MSSALELPVIVSWPEEPSHLSGAPLLHSILSSVETWAAAMPAESASNNAPARTTLTVLLISSPSRKGWGAVHSSLHARTNHTRGREVVHVALSSPTVGTEAGPRGPWARGRGGPPRSRWQPPVPRRRPAGARRGPGRRGPAPSRWQARRGPRRRRSSSRG